MDPSFPLRLSERAALARVAMPDSLRDVLTTYFQLLSRWNTKINLTSLTDTNEAIDRLLLEPVAAAALLPPHAALLDLGSGGGSPAIPLALALDASRLVMVESRGRKAAFLREAARATGLSALVHEARFEELARRGTHLGEMDVVSMRAVRMDAPALESARAFLKPAGVLALFVTSGSPLPPALLPCAGHHLIGNADLLLCANVPRGTSE